MSPMLTIRLPHQIGDSIMIAVGLGLVFDKPIGIFLISYLLVKFKVAQLPLHVNWPMILGAGCLAGIGITMSLFIALLSLDGELLNVAKSGIIIGTFINPCLGLLFLSFRPNL